MVDARACPPSRAGSAGVRRPPRSRSRARPAPTAAATPSGTCSRARPRARRVERRRRGRQLPSLARRRGALAELGVDDYRFSIAWPRVRPSRLRARERGRPRPYARLVDALLEADIRPVPTLYHWDLPQPLEDAGGWPARDTAARFADYVELVLGRLGDRVGH